MVSDPKRFGLSGRASGLSRECSVLYSEGNFFPFPSHSPEHHIGAPDQNLLPEDPKLNSFCGFRAYQNDSSIFITPFEIGTLQSEQELCAIQCHQTQQRQYSSPCIICPLKEIIFYIGEERLPRAIASARMWAPLMAGSLTSACGCSFTPHHSLSPLVA